MFSLPQQYVLQIADRINVWRNSSSHWSVEDAIDSALLQIQFNPALQMRIQDSLNNEIVWKSDNLPDFLDVKIATNTIGGIV